MNLSNEIFQNFEKLSYEEQEAIRVFLLQKGKIYLAREINPISIPEVSL